jgi:glycosyltransferase involved in cell wall biosynthesis
MHDIDRGELRAPACVLDVDVTVDDDGKLIDVARFQTAWCLLRRDGVAVATRFLDVGGDEQIALSSLSIGGAATAEDPAIEVTGDLSASLTVVICTRDRQDGLMRTLASLANQSDPAFEVLIVDNSLDGELARTLCGVPGLVLRCCHEPAPGLSRARNRGLAQVHTDLVAWIDDDEVADDDWIAWLKRGFASESRPDAVAGVMLPAELETEAQVNFERYGGFNKGRGMQPEQLRAGTPSVPDPLYPLPSFGAGGNMAFRTKALRATGGFDDRLGAGTMTHGGEDTGALSLILQSGSTVLHWPPAVTWHYHRRGDDALERQLYGYNAGLTAFYMSMLFTSPRSLWRILALVPRGVHHILVHRRTSESDGPMAGFPDRLLRASRKGLLAGAWLYVREAHRQRSYGRRVGRRRQSEQVRP